MRRSKLNAGDRKLIHALQNKGGVHDSLESRYFTTEKNSESKIVRMKSILVAN